MMRAMVGLAGEHRKILRDIAEAWLVADDSLRLPPGHKCAHGVYIPANSRYRDRARYCSICHPYIILRYSKLRPILRSELLWWSPNAATVNNIRYSGRQFPPFPAPHWIGEPRPQGARQVRLQTRFPDTKFLTYQVEEFGYDGHAAFAAMVRAHQPWRRTVDRRRAPTASVVHPYNPAAPGRRTKVGGGLTKEKVHQALAKKRWEPSMKEAVFEIVYRRRSLFKTHDLAISARLSLPVRDEKTPACLDHCICWLSRSFASPNSLLRSSLPNKVGPICFASQSEAVAERSVAPA